MPEYQKQLIVRMQRQLVVRVLIVEDDIKTVQSIRSSLEDITSDEKRRLGIERFSFDIAASRADALEKLAQATLNETPYHLMLLDLSLPAKTGDLEEDPENGFKILAEARASDSVIETVIISVLNYVSYVARGFRGGALDFVPKPFERSELQDRILASWKRVLEKLNNETLDHRLRETIPYDAQGWAYRFGSCFSALTQEVFHNVEQLEGELGERLGLNARTDAQDSLLRYLEAMVVSVRKSKQAWAALQDLLPKGMWPKEEEQPQKYYVAELLSELEVELTPSLIVRQVEMALPSVQDIEVRSFYQDVKMVLKELILGALCELTSYFESEKKRTLEVKIETTATYAQVIFSGELFRFDEQTKRSLQEKQWQNDGQFGQAWGLSVAQHIALRGGGRLQIGSESQPDSVTYFIPLAQHG